MPKGSGANKKITPNFFRTKLPEMESDEFSDEFSQFSSPLPCGLQQGDSNRSWNPLSQAWIYLWKCKKSVITKELFAICFANQISLCK
jgi:hypothetical protein